MKTCALAMALALSISAAVIAQDEKPAEAKSAQSAEKTETGLLTIGDKAPPLAIEKWVKGTPVSAFEKGKVYVVEFWATWCGPCIAGMPHLTELQAKYKNKGVTIIGVTSADPRNTLEAVEKMVESKGDEKMGYSVAWDKERTTNEAYMRAAKQRGIPCAFVVNQDGIVSWIGHPMEMDEPLDQIVNGKFDIKAAATEFKKRQEEDAAEMAAQEEMMKIMQLARKQDFSGAVKAADEVIAKHPEMAPNIATIKFRLLLTGTKEYEKAYAFAREAAEKYYSKNPMALNDIAWTILDAEGVDQRDADVAITLAKRAVELTNESDGAILDTLALAYFQKGDSRKALELQKKAVELITKAGAPEDMIDEMKERLEQFEKAANKKE